MFNKFRINDAASKLYQSSRMGGASRFEEESDEIKEIFRTRARKTILGAFPEFDGFRGSAAIIDRGALKMAINVLRRSGKDEVADALASSVIAIGD